MNTACRYEAYEKVGRGEREKVGRERKGEGERERKGGWNTGIGTT